MEINYSKLDESCLMINSCVYIMLMFICHFHSFHYKSITFLIMSSLWIYKVIHILSLSRNIRLFFKYNPPLSTNFTISVNFKVHTCIWGKRLYNNFCLFHFFCEHCNEILTDDWIMNDSIIKNSKHFVLHNRTNRFQYINTWVHVLSFIIQPLLLQ